MKLNQRRWNERNFSWVTLISTQITDRALRKTCQLCISTLTLFLSILVRWRFPLKFYPTFCQGSECASAGLRVLATGGVYIAGGIPLKILPRILEDDCVHSNFKNHNSSMNSLVAKFPLKVVTHPQVGLLGAKVYYMNFCFHQII